MGVAALPRSSALAAEDSSVFGKPALSRGNHVNPFVYAFNIGVIEAWSISDGHMLFKDGVKLMWPPEQRDAMTRNLQEHGERTDGFPLYINVLVLRHGREVVLFDSGFGVRANPIPDGVWFVLTPLLA